MPVHSRSIRRNWNGGLDLSSTCDLTSFVLVFPPDDKENGLYHILPFFWLPEDTLKDRVRRDHVPYDIWNRQGYINVTPGNVVDYGYIRKTINELGEKYRIHEIAFDRWNAEHIAQELDDDGYTLCKYGQGFKDMSPAAKDLMRLTLQKRLAHGGHPVLRWNMDNITIKMDEAENIKPDKARSTEKIDGAVATMMALERAVVAYDPSSVYDTRGLVTL